MTGLRIDRAGTRPLAGRDGKGAAPTASVVAPEGLVDEALPEDMSPADLVAEVGRLRYENRKLRTIRDALIRHVDRNHDINGTANRFLRGTLEVETSVEKRIQRLARTMSEAKIARRQLRQAIECIGEGFILYDRDDRVIIYNRKYVKLFPKLAGILKPGVTFRDLIQKAAETGLVVESVTDPQAWIAARAAYHQRSSCRFQQLLGDGRWVQISERATDEGGKVTIVSDITHFKRLEETRRLSKTAQDSDLLATTVASIAQGVLVFDSNLTLTTWNSQAVMLLNLPYVELHVGATVRDLLHLVWRHGARVSRDSKREVESWVRDVKRRYPLRIEMIYPGDRALSANFRGMPDDGFVVTLMDVSHQLQATLLLARNNEELERRVQERTGELIRVNEILRDEVDRHEKTAAALERTRKAAEAVSLSKMRFLAAASHDLLQPLNAARLYLTALETSPFVDPGAMDLIGKMGQAFQSTEELLNTILDISKMDAGGYQPKFSSVELSPLFQTLETEFEPQARHKKLRLRMVPCSDVVWSDAQLLRRIIQNFLSNAIKYTERGTILIGARHQSGKLSIEVHDSGIGIAPEDREVIFEEFRRVTSSPLETRGLGLGLAIVKRAADLLGHEVGLRSRPGKGSSFSLKVPLQRTVAPCAPGGKGQPWYRQGDSLPAAAAVAEEEDEGLFFILENDESVAHAMSTLLAHWKMNAVIAPSFPAMLDVIRRHGVTPTAIIADLHLDGDIDGIDAIILLREHLGTNLPGILVTADQSSVIKDRARAKQIEYFSKPVKAAQLRAYLLLLSKPEPSSAALPSESSV